MRSRIGIVAALVTSAHVTASKAEEPKIVVITGQDGAVVSLRSAERLEVRLPAQLGTGFSWALATPSAMLKRGGTRLEAAEQTKPGSPETQVFGFTAALPGTDTLHFVYRQPWMPNVPAKRLDITVRITPKND